MIVEAMKTMNHVPSTSDGTVKKILVNDGQPVEFGQPLIILNNNVQKSIDCKQRRDCCENYQGM